MTAETPTVYPAVRVPWGIGRGNDGGRPFRTGRGVHEARLLPWKPGFSSASVVEKPGFEARSRASGRPSPGPGVEDLLPAGVPLVQRQVAVVHLQGQQAHARRADPAAALADPRRVRVPTAVVGVVLLLLDADEPVAHPADPLAVDQRALVPGLPLVAL